GIAHALVGIHLGDVGAVVGGRRDELGRIGYGAQKPHLRQRIGLIGFRVRDRGPYLIQARHDRIAAHAAAAADDAVDDRGDVVHAVMVHAPVLAVIEAAETHGRSSYMLITVMAGRAIATTIARVVPAIHDSI